MFSGCFCTYRVSAEVVSLETVLRDRSALGVAKVDETDVAVAA